MKTKRNTRLRREREHKDCDRCGFPYLKIELIRQGGINVCKTCYDEPGYKESSK